MTVTWNATGPYQIALEACDGSFCDTVFQPVVVNSLPIANAGSDVDICQGGNAQLFASGGVAYLWTPSTGLNDDDIPNPIASPTVTTVYTVTVYDNNGCFASDQVTVTVLPPAAANAGADQTICTGDTAQLQGSGGVTYSWTPTASLSNSSISNPVAFPSVTTTYTLTVTNAQGCFGTVEVTVFIDNLPPSITCPSNLVVANDPGQCSAVYSYQAATATDNCPGLSTVLLSGPGNLVKLYAIDGSGNIDSCSAVVQVLDVTPPQLVCPPDTTVNAGGQFSAQVNYPLPVATDNCSATVSLQAGLGSGASFPIGTTTERYEAIDPSGNGVSCLFQVEVLPGNNRTNSAAGAAGSEESLNLQVYPNPFSQRLTFQLRLEKRSPIRLTISSAEGKVLYSVVTEEMEPGVHRLFWNGRDGSGNTVTSGIYIYRLQAAGHTEFGRVEFLRD